MKRVDDAYDREDLAALYDRLNPGGPDTDFYLTLPQPGEGILDIGCGTGNIALRLADRGHRVTGTDPATGMLSIARRNDKDGKVDWIAGYGQDFRTEARFDLAIMTGHVFQVFLTDEETLYAFRNIHRHLKPGGRLVFESRNPLKRDWQTWTKELSRLQVLSPDFGAIEVHYQWLKAEGELVTFETIFAFENGRIERSLSTLRFPSKEKIEALLREAGFSKFGWLGDWDGSPCGEDSEEIITTAWR